MLSELLREFGMILGMKEIICSIAMEVSLKWTWQTKMKAMKLVITVSSAKKIMFNFLKKAVAKKVKMVEILHN